MKTMEIIRCYWLFNIFQILPFHLNKLPKTKSEMDLCGKVN